MEYAPDSEACADYQRVVDWMLEVPAVAICPDDLEDESSDSTGQVAPMMAPEASSSPRAAELAQRLRNKAEEALGPSQGPTLGPEARPGVFSIVQPAILGERIGITGDFNQWHAIGLQLNRLEGALDEALVGIELPVTPGLVRYRLVVDGEELLDPSNPRSGEGPDGRPCSVVEIPSANVETTPWTPTATPLTN